KSQPIGDLPYFFRLPSPYVRDRHVVSMIVSKSEYLGLNARRRSAREASATRVAGSPGRLGARRTGTRWPVIRSMADTISRTEYARPVPRLSINASAPLLT